MKGAVVRPGKELQFEDLRSYVLGSMSLSKLRQKATKIKEDGRQRAIAMIPRNHSAFTSLSVLKPYIQDRVYACVRLSKSESPSKDKGRHEEKRASPWIHSCAGFYEGPDLSVDEPMFVEPSWIDSLLDLFNDAYSTFHDDEEWLADWKVSEWGDKRELKAIEFMEDHQDPLKLLLAEKHARWFIASKTDEWEVKGLQWKERCAALDDAGFGPEFKRARLQKIYRTMGLDYRVRC
jgi:hypothetical protein